MVLTINKSPQDTASLLAWAEALRCVAYRLEGIAAKQRAFEVRSEPIPSGSVGEAFPKGNR
jgi:hypothetical protein